MTEQKAGYITDAMDMLGKGYEHPSIEIHPQTVVIRRRGKEMTEEVVPSQIYISTNFKSELGDIDGTALKIWIFIALSLNRNTEVAFPSLATIAKVCKIGENTAVKHIRALEAAGLLAVKRGNRKVNIYSIPEYAFANLRTASKTEVDSETASENAQTTSENDQTTSSSGRSNHINHINQLNNNAPKIDLSKAGIEWTVLAGRDISPEQIVAAKLEQVHLDEYERAMGYNPLPWDSPKFSKLRDFLVKQTLEDIRIFAEWSRRDYSSFKPDKAINYPKEVIYNWPQAFIPKPTRKRRSKKNDSFYEKLRRA